MNNLKKYSIPSKHVVLNKNFSALLERSNAREKINTQEIDLKKENSVLIEENKKLVRKLKESENTILNLNKKLIARKGFSI